MGKITKTFSIDEKKYEKFEEICKMKAINKSSMIQMAIDQFIVDNYDIDTNIRYKLVGDKTNEFVQIKEKIDKYIVLNNGNQLDIYTFEKMYESFDADVAKVLEEIDPTKKFDEDDVDDVDEVYPNILYSSSLSMDKIKQVFENIDIDSIDRYPLENDPITTTKVVEEQIDSEIKDYKK